MTPPILRPCPVSDAYGYDPGNARVYSVWPLNPDTGRPLRFLKAIQAGPEEPSPAPDAYRNRTQFFFASSANEES